MKLVYWVFLMVLISQTVWAQAPCDETFKKGLRKDGKFTAPCDSMVVLSKQAFEQLNFRIIRLQKEVALHEKGLASLNQSIALRDSLVQVYQKEITDFENYLKDTAGPIAKLQVNLEKSIENTDRVIRIAHRNKILGVVAGALAGLLVGSVAF